MATIESLQSEISNLRQDILKLNNEMVKKSEFDQANSQIDFINKALIALNIAFTTYQGVQSIKLAKLTAAATKAQFMAQTSLNKCWVLEGQIKGLQAKVIATSATAGAAAGTATKLSRLVPWVGILVAFAGTALNIYGSLKIIERIDIMESIQHQTNERITDIALKGVRLANLASQAVKILEKNTKEGLRIITNKHEQLVKTTKQEDIKIRKDFSRADSQIRTDYKNADSQITTNFKKADSQIRTDYKKADSQIRTDYKNADNQITTNFKKADSQITTNFKKADSQIRTDYKKADDVIKSNVKQIDIKATKAQKTADTVTTNHNKLVVSFNGFSQKVNNWVSSANQKINQLSTSLKQTDSKATKSQITADKANKLASEANDLAKTALQNNVEIKTRIESLNNDITKVNQKANTAVSGLEQAKIKHNSLVDNFNKFNKLVNTWIETNDKLLIKLNDNINQLWIEVKKLMNLDLTPVIKKIDDLQVNNERSHSYTQQILNGGLITLGAGMTANKLQLTNIGGQLTKLNTTVGTGFTGVTNLVNNGFKTVGTATKTITNGISGVGNKIKDLSGKFDFSFILQLISTAASLHNAVMLSQDVLQSFFIIFDNLFAIFGVKDAEGNNLNIGTIIGQGIKDILISVIGAKTAAEITTKWNIYNRIYQSATNVYYNIQNLFSTMTSLTTNVLNNTGKIGNALVNYRVIGENAFPTMPENVQPTGRIGKLNTAIINATGSIENIANFANAFNMITSDVLSVKSEIESTRDNIAELNKAVEESSKPIEATSLKDKESSFPSI